MNITIQFYSGQNRTVKAGHEVSMPKYVSLTTWANKYYDDPPSIGTLRRWARNGNIYPPPDIEGREYRVDPNAFYIKPKKCGMKLEQHQPNGRIGKKSSLLERLINESEKKIRC